MLTEQQMINGMEAVVDSSRVIGRCRGTVETCQRIMADFPNQPDLITWATNRLTAAQNELSELGAFLQIMV